MEFAHPENSTTVRINDFEHGESIADPIPPQPRQPQPDAAWLRRDWRLSLLRAGMRALSAASPALAVRLFDRIWFSAPRTRARSEARDVLATGERHAFELHGRRVVAWSWGQGPTVLLLHGWGGNAGQLHAFVAPLRDAGYRVVAFDAPAHGQSGPSRHGGRRVTFFEIADALRMVSAAFGPLHALVAHSGGCAVTGLALRDGWDAPTRIAFVSPYALPSTSIEPFGRTIGASTRVIDLFRTRTERRLGRAWTEFDVPTLAQHRELPPLLLVHDREDREVPFAHSLALAAAWPQARMKATDGLGHRRLLGDAAVVNDVVGFIGPPSTQDELPTDGRDELDRWFDLAS